MAFDEIETDSPTVIKVPRGGIWHVPGARNPYFTGRDLPLAKLDEQFKKAGDRLAVTVIVGLGGVGKTQLAAEFAWRHRADYSVIWWLPADDATTLALAYAQLAKRLGLHLRESADLDTARHHLRRALATINNWLLIFDNADSADAIENYLPLTRSGHVLITSRDTQWAGDVDTYSLRVMEHDEAVQFLIRRVGARGRGPAKEKLAGQLAQALGNHPLAMEQAGAHIVESRIDFTTYLKRFESHWAELLAQGSGLATPGAEYSDSLAMSLELTFRQLEDSLSAAQPLLNLMAFFAGESIPNWLLDTAERVGDSFPLNLMPLIMDRQCRDEALATLRRYSLVECDDENKDHLQVHRLVAALARRRLSTIERVDLTSASLRIVIAAFDFDSQDPRTWPVCAQVLPHALAVAAHAESLGVEQESAAKVLNVAGRFMMRQNRLPEARETLTAALNLARKVHGPYHARLAGMSNDLGRVLQKLGDAAAAREFFEKSLRIEENIYGVSGSRCASVLNNYAMTLHTDGDFSAAREHLQRALTACEFEHGAAHWRVAMVRNNLACVFRDSGEAASARGQFELALKSARNGSGEMHPAVAQIAFNLGVLLRSAGDLRKAQEQLALALQVDRYNFGPVHPDVARDLTELAAISRSMGDLMTAEQYETEARAAFPATLAAEAASPA